MIEILPKKSVGPFIFNTCIDDYLDKYKPDEISDYDPVTNDLYYQFLKNTLYVYVEEGIITSISIYSECYLRNINIYMMGVDDFMEIFTISKKERTADDRIWVADNEQQDVYEISSLGLRLWVSDFMKIVAISAHG